jgi:hypothetical protein
MKQRAGLVLPFLLALTPTQAWAAQPPPSGAHPRIWLDAATVSGLKAQPGTGKGPVARGAARCTAARTNPNEYATGGWQGFEFVTTLSGCLASWEATGNTDDLATAIKYWNVLLDDYQKVGDGAGGDNVVTHDTGYAMRTFAPYSAIAYDWLHDAPGVTESMRAHARARFDAWVQFYANSGYLRHMPGSNYEAGFAFAATLIAIAEGGEAGAAGESHWQIVRDTIWGTDLAGGLRPGGVLDGGDWAEGWQYGPLSVLEHALAARAMGDNGVPIAGIGPWADSLALRFAHGLTPTTQKTFAAGDTEATTNHLEPTNGALLAVIAGPAGATARSWARYFNTSLGLTNENALFDALAAARSGPSAPMPADSPTNYVARGTGNWYARGAWAKNTVWSVFSCSHRLVDDHQHNDAGNWVLTRGADDVVVDPSPYGSLSSLTSNAPAVDSAVLPPGYSPSQANWGHTTRLVWAKQSTSGIGVARCDYADQFSRSDVPSDVAHAIRDFVLVPNGDNGTVVLVDRVVTGDASRSLHLRVRSPSNLALSGNAATATIGASSLTIQKLWATSGSPSVRDMPLSPECSSDNRGTCDISRLPSGQEYRLDVSGPNAAAIHVVDAQAAGASPPANQLLSGAGYRGVLLGQPGAHVAVILDDGVDGTPRTSLTYRVPAGAGTTHVVVDAPSDANGLSDVASRLDGSDCVVTVTQHAKATGGFDGHGLVVRLTSNCSSAEDGAVPPIDTGSTGGTGSTAGTGGVAASAGGVAASAGGVAASAGAPGASGSVPGAGGVTSGPTGNGGSSGGQATNSGGASDPAGLGSGVVHPGTGAPDSTGCSLSRKALARPRNAAPWSSIAIGAAALVIASRRRRAARRG